MNSVAAPTPERRPRGGGSRVATPREAPPAKLYTAVMIRPDVDPAPLLLSLAGRYGEIETRCAPFAFDGSDYYEPEMGPGLVKYFVSFERPVAQQRLAVVKLETNLLEAQGADARGRVYNLDPGIVTHYSVVVATTKGYAHRVYLGAGVYAEPALLYRAGGWEALPWTYPDYRTDVVRAFFLEARRRLRQQSAGAGSPPV